MEMNIVMGTTSESKINALKKSLKELDISTILRLEVVGHQKYRILNHNKSFLLKC